MGPLLQEQRIVIRNQTIAAYRANSEVTVVLRGDEPPTRPARARRTAK